MSKDYYNILGIKPESNKGEIKKAYRKLAMEYHPDKNNGDEKYEEKFKDITEAYSTLSNDENKAIYDAKRSYGARGNSRFRANVDPSKFGNFTFDDFVNDMFKSNRTGQPRRKARRDPSFSGENFSFDTSHLNINIVIEKDILSLLNEDSLLIEYQRNNIDGKKEDKKIKFKINLRSKHNTILEENGIYYIKVSLDGMGSEHVIQRMNIWGEREQFVIMGSLIVRINITSDQKFKIENGDIVQDIEIDLHTALFDNEESFVVNSMLGKKYKIDIRKPKNLSSLKFTVKGLGILRNNNTLGNYIANLLVKSPDLDKLPVKDKKSLERILSNKDLY